MLRRFFPRRLSPEQSSGVVRHLPGDYQLDPNHWRNDIPMMPLGDRVWSGIQKDNGVTALLAAPNFLGRNPYQTQLEKTDRILKESGGPLSHNSMGPALYAELMLQVV